MLTGCLVRQERGLKMDFIERKLFFREALIHSILPLPARRTLHPSLFRDIADAKTVLLIRNPAWFPAVMVNKIQIE
jgi:hypothetical protein